jgi:hypothetical protein
VWTPKSEQDILSAIAAGDLSETANFDGKSALPGKGKSKDLADSEFSRVCLLTILGRTLRWYSSKGDRPKTGLRSEWRLSAP